jgi:hypothetical protein
MVKKAPPQDRDKLKIASFRTTEGEWFDFAQLAEMNGLTATDVLKGAMQLFLDRRLDLPGNDYVSATIASDTAHLSDIIARLEALENAMDSVKSQLPSKNLATAATKATYKVDR